MSEAVQLALIAALTGGVALEVIRRVFGRAESAHNDLVEFRHELVRENTRLRKELTEIRVELEVTQRKLMDATRRVAELSGRRGRAPDIGDLS